jgi:hypothetical protein
LVCKISNDNFKDQVINLFEFIIYPDDEFLLEKNDIRSFSIYPMNIDFVKCLMWICSFLDDKKLLLTILRLAERSFRKIPKLGSSSPSLGQACLYSLYEMKESWGIEQLLHLKLSIKSTKAQKVIEKLLCKIPC